MVEPDTAGSGGLVPDEAAPGGLVPGWAEADSAGYPRPMARSRLISTTTRSGFGEGVRPYRSA